MYRVEQELVVAGVHPHAYQMSSRMYRDCGECMCNRHDVGLPARKMVGVNVGTPLPEHFT